MPTEPFQNSYTDSSKTTVGGATPPAPQVPPAEPISAPAVEKTATHAIDAYFEVGTQTPSVGEVYGTEKTRRVKIKGKISK